MTACEDDRTDRLGVDRRRFLGLALKAGALAVLPLGLPRSVSAGDGIETARSVLAGDGIETARAWRAMGTLMEVRVPDLPRAEAVEAIRSVRRRVEELEAALTLYRTESPLVAFNAGPAGRWLDVPADLSVAVNAALAGARESAGAYDPTVAPLMRAWGLVHLDGAVPSREARRAWRRRPGPEAAEVDLGNRRLRRHHDEVEIDLGGIGKGIAVDAALAELSQAGSRSALVNFGGGIGVLGAPSNSPEGWPVAVAHPRRRGDIWSTHFLRSGHLATSGDYERMVETKAGRAHHLLDPRTGEPAPGVASVTVWSRTGVEADVLSTAMFIATARDGAGGSSARPTKATTEVPSLVLRNEGADIIETTTDSLGRSLG